MSAAAAVPRLTLGLPAYNGERFLAESLDALLAQTYTDFELIISDNGSTDRTGEIARRYEAKDHRVRYVHHPVNRGSTFNHNFVIGQARGELFKWVSDDDLYDPAAAATASRRSMPDRRLRWRTPGPPSSTTRERSPTRSTTR